MTRKKKNSEPQATETARERYIKWSVSWIKNKGRQWQKLELADEYPEIDKTNLEFIYQPFLGSDQDFENVKHPDDVHELNMKLRGQNGNA